MEKSRALLLLVAAGLAACSMKSAQISERESEEDSAPEGDYWALRATYPTGAFSGKWIVDAREQDRSIASGVPSGAKVYARSAQSPLALDPLRFTPLGPKPLNPSYATAGRVNVVVVDPVTPTIAYLGADGGGVWKTSNCCSAATTWTVVTDFPEISSTAIGDLTLDPNDHNVLYAGTGDLRYGSFSFGASGVLKSSDQGQTWQVLGADIFNPFYAPSAGGFPQYQAIGKVVVDPNDSDRVIVGTKTGIYLSYDAGLNWTGPCLTNTFASQRQDTTGLLAVDNGSSTSLYAAIGTRGSPTPVQPNLDQNGANGIYRVDVPSSGCPSGWTLLSRADNGWPTGIANGTPNRPIGRIDLAIAPSNNQIIYAQVANPTTREVLGVWRTTNGGTSWTQRAITADFGGCSDAGAQAWYDAGISVDPNNPDVIFLSAVDLFRSTNGADTFTDLTCGYSGGDVHVDHHARAFVGSDSNKLLFGSDGGAFYTGNAQATSPTFVPLSASLNTIEFYSGDITANFATAANPGASGGAQDNGSSSVVFSGSPTASPWIERMGGDGIFTRIEPVNAQRWYYSSQNGSVAVTSSGPAGALSNASGAWSADRKPFIMPFELYKYGDNSSCGPPDGCERMIAGTYRVWETLQGGLPTSSWAPRTGDLTKNTLSSRSTINQLAYSVSDPTIAVVGTNDGNVQYVFGLGGAGAAVAVNVTDGNAVLPNRPIMDVATDPLNPRIAYAAVGGFDQNTPTRPGHVFQVVCTANCTSFVWADKSGNLPNIPVNSIIANPHIPNQVFAGSDWGLYFTDNIAAAAPVWTRFEEGLPHAMIWDMAIDRGFTTLALFTRSRGAWAWPLPTALNDVIFANGFQPLP